MKRFSTISIVLFMSTIVLGLASAQASETVTVKPQYATGVVFNDNNKNGIRDKDEKGLQGVRVSNGSTTVKTDRAGRYRLPVDDDTVIFVIKPRNWRTRVDANNIPRFYYIHNPNGSPKLETSGVAPTGPLPASVDFPLYHAPEPNRFRTIFFADPQVTPFSIPCFSHDIIEELVGTDAAFAVTLGDIAYVMPDVYEQLVPVMGQLGFPCYSVKGNHDTNEDAPNRESLAATFMRMFGPEYYSFDYGPVHFVSLNTPYMMIHSTTYEGRLGDEQMAWLRDDLASIPKKQLVVLMMHMPLTDITTTDRAEIFKLLENRPHVFAIAGHWHYQEHVFFTAADGWAGATPLHQMINTTACGPWWGGKLDEVGLPHATQWDGTPNGYSIITFDGSKYSIRLKAARRPADYQMNIYAPDDVESAKTGATEVLVNVFAGSARSKVEMRFGKDGVWTPMERFVTNDPAWMSMREREGDAITTTIEPCQHIWKATLPENIAVGTYLIHVRTTDMFGQTDTAVRVINIR